MALGYLVHLLSEKYNYITTFSDYLHIYGALKIIIVDSFKTNRGFRVPRIDATFGLLYLERRRNDGSIVQFFKGGEVKLLAPCSTDWWSTLGISPKYKWTAKVWIAELLRRFLW